MSKKKEPIDIDWLEVAKIGMPVVGPFVQGALWYGFLNLDKRAQALGRFIAVAEVVPAVDLNLPSGVVLASMFDSVEEAIEIYDKIVESISDLPDSIRDLLKDIKDTIPTKEDIPFVPEAQEASHEFQKALAECIANAQNQFDNKYTYAIFAGPWVVSCMLQKGFSVPLSYVKEKLF
ncbi:MAG: hypothetical protein [Circular genetic element sp.]|nr:MAG: hypothetical protein [Circular genetic element sp.]